VLSVFTRGAVELCRVKFLEYDDEAEVRCTALALNALKNCVMLLSAGSSVRFEAARQASARAEAGERQSSVGVRCTRSSSASGVCIPVACITVAFLRRQGPRFEHP
jgi:hypothetical protein